MQPQKHKHQKPHIVILFLCDMALCLTKFLSLLLVLSAIPIGIIVTLERTKPTTNAYYYHSSAWFREEAKWDPRNRRFIVSFFEGGLGQLKVPENGSSLLEEITVVKEPHVARNASLGVAVDPPRNRVLVVNADVCKNLYGELAAYDLSTWNRLFRTQLSGPSDGKSLADDIAVDDEGNAYVIDALGNKIWKVSVEGKLVSTIRDPMLSPKKWWYKHFVGLNGIVYHPDGFLIAVHTLSGDLFKIEGEESVKIIKVTGGTGNPPGKLDYADGLALLSPTKVVVVGNPPARLVESNDGWNTASVVGTFSGLKHRFATGATVKDGKVYLNYMIGMGYPKRKHAIVEAVF